MCTSHTPFFTASKYCHMFAIKYSVFRVAVEIVMLDLDQRVYGEIYFEITRMVF